MSAWTGFNLAGGEKLGWELTPMIGCLLGNSAGVAPGYKGSLSWWKLELYSEGDYVFDAGDASDNSSTTGRRTPRSVHLHAAIPTTYVFNPDHDKPTTVVAFGVQL